jgi:hypothetical protein
MAGTTFQREFNQATSSAAISAGLSDPATVTAMGTGTPASGDTLLGAVGGIFKKFAARLMFDTWLGGLTSEVGRSLTAHMADLSYPVTAWGAKLDAKTVTSVTISLSTPTTVTASVATFAATDVGKKIFLPGAGAAGVVLVTTISAYTSTTVVSITDAASTAITAIPCVYGTDDTAAFQAAALSNAHTIIVPLTTGGAIITGQVTIGSSGGTKTQRWAAAGAGTATSRIRCLGGTIAHFVLQGQFCSMDGFFFDGSIAGEFGSTGGVSYGGVGVVMGSLTAAIAGERMVLTRCEAAWFTQAGFVAAGLQNSTIQDCKGQYNKFNFAILNGARNVCLLSCNATDWATEASAWVTAQMIALKPGCRNIYIGNDSLGGIITVPTITWATEGGFLGKVPSNIAVIRGIYERDNRHTNNIEVGGYFDKLWLDNIEVTYAVDGGALFKMAAWQFTYNSRLRPEVAITSPNFIVQGTEARFDVGAGVHVTMTGPDLITLGTGTINRLCGDQDVGAGIQLIDAPSKFSTADIGLWLAYGTGSAHAHRQQAGGGH